MCGRDLTLSFQINCSLFESPSIKCLTSNPTKESFDDELLQTSLIFSGKINPREALRELEKAMPGNAMVSTDIGNVCSTSNGYLRFDQSPSFLAAMTFGNCQYALGAAMGAKLAAPERPAIAYVGDGAWGMSLNEVLTCIREKIPTTAVVFHNAQWGAEKKNQVRAVYVHEHIRTEIFI